MEKVTMRDQAIGKVVTNKFGQSIVVVGYPDGKYCGDVYARFIESGHEIRVRLSDLLKGIFRDGEDPSALPGEEWRDIAGYEGRYMVSNLGRVKSLPNRTRRRERIMRGQMIRRYLSVPLVDESGKIKQGRIHRMVATAFVPNPNNLPQVNHKDENRLNNRADNLEWCDARYNVNYGTAPQRRVDAYKRNNHGKPRPYFYKPVEMITFDDEVIKRFPSIKHASEETGIPCNIISEVCKRYVEGGKKRKYKYEFKWRYAKR